MFMKWWTMNQLQAPSWWDVSCLHLKPMLKQEPDACQILVKQTHNTVLVERKSWQHKKDCCNVNQERIASTFAPFGYSF